MIDTSGIMIIVGLVLFLICAVGCGLASARQWTKEFDRNNAEEAPLTPKRITELRVSFPVVIAKGCLVEMKFIQLTGVVTRRNPKRLSSLSNTPIAIRFLILLSTFKCCHFIPMIKAPPIILYISKYKRLSVVIFPVYIQMSEGLLIAIVGVAAIVATVGLAELLNRVHKPQANSSS
ncbi:hypothetical protein BDB01DRAFT_838652 [Pilobolus umbonatus]|nr:hypothetical protein BDB01DRAFT_838652 [Pilobolus umbonatus]